MTRPTAPRPSGQGPSGRKASGEKEPGRKKPGQEPPARRQPARREPGAGKTGTGKAGVPGAGGTGRRRPAAGAAQRAAGDRRPRGPKGGPSAKAGPQEAGPPKPPRHPPGTYRRRRLAAALAALLLLVGLGLTVRVLLYDAGLADVQDVQVTGASAVPVPDVLAAAAVTPGGPLAAIDPTGIATRVAALPAVASATVTRGWPHTVQIAITERVPVASVATAGGVALLDETGVVYAGTPGPGLPRLDVGSPGPDDPSTRAALTALTALPAAVRTQVRTVDVSPAAGSTGLVTFGLDGDKQVRWGTPERSADKAAVLVPLLTQEGSVYDVTSPDLPTIRR